MQHKTDLDIVVFTKVGQLMLSINEKTAENQPPELVDFY